MKKLSALLLAVILVLSLAACASTAKNDEPAPDASEAAKLTMATEATFINGDAQQFTDAKAYLDCIREELPHEATTGFRFRTITQDPAVRKAVDDIVFDLYGEENPYREEDYNLAPSEEMQMGGM